MIAYLKGRLLEKSPEFAVIECNGIGFKVGITLKTFYRLPEPDSEVEFFISMFVRESAVDLYGFVDRYEREVFELVADVSGLGPRQGRNILSGIDAKDLVEAILAGDLTKLVSIHGVGRKRAEQMVFELKDRLGVKRDISLGLYDQLFSDAVMALMSLGYNKSDSEAAVSKAKAVMAKEVSLEDLIRQVLGVISGSKGVLREKKP